MGLDQPVYLGNDKSVYLPEGFEAGYAYPLIVWLHGHAGSERELQEVMPAVSARNYLGISFRGSMPAADGLPGTFRWSQSEDHLLAIEQEVDETLSQVKDVYRIHPQRIYVAGFGEGATVGLRLMLRQPEQFAGVISMGGAFPKLDQPLARFRSLQGKRVLLAAGSRDTSTAAADLVSASRLLRSAGMDTTVRYYDAGHELCPNMLRDIDTWVMSNISTAYVVR